MHAMSNFNMVVNLNGHAALSRMMVKSLEMTMNSNFSNKHFNYESYSKNTGHSLLRDIDIIKFNIIK